MYDLINVNQNVLVEQSRDSRHRGIIQYYMYRGQT